jgi:hypothetical protein
VQPHSGRRIVIDVTLSAAQGLVILKSLRFFGPLRGPQNDKRMHAVTLPPLDLR